MFIIIKQQAGIRSDKQRFDDYLYDERIKFLKEMGKKNDKRK
jgi:hypothetical protein